MQRIQKFGMSAMRKYCTAPQYSYKSLEIKRPHEHVIHIALNCPEKRNPITSQFIDDYINCFEEISKDENCRSVILSGNGKLFSSGIDFSCLMEMGQVIYTDEDISRKYKELQGKIRHFQKIFYLPYICPKPVIAAIHNGCLGVASSVVAGADIRFCTADSYFFIKEVVVGLAPDVGILQKLAKSSANDSLVRELLLTGRTFTADEALRLGFVSKIYKDAEELMKAAIETAVSIAEKGPVPVQTTKQAMNYSTDHSIEDGLEYMALVNGTHLQSEDMMKSFMALLNKEKAVFSKL